MSSSSPIQTPVTGREDTTDQRQTAHALAQFYRALNSRDLPLMQENWADSVEAGTFRFEFYTTTGFTKPAMSSTWSGVSVVNST